MRSSTRLLFTALALALAGCGTETTSPQTPPEDPNFLTDHRDGTIYPVVAIGKQVWMAKNLAYKGTGTDTVGVCSSFLAANCATYGRLYTWIEASGLSASFKTTLSTSTTPVQGVCPSGWHLPTDGEWKTLDSAVLHRATTLRSALWNGTDSTGFAALPGGSRQNTGGFVVLGSDGYFWTSTNKYAAEGTYWYMIGSESFVRSFSYSKLSSLSVRCLKN